MKTVNKKKAKLSRALASKLDAFETSTRVHYFDSGQRGYEHAETEEERVVARTQLVVAMTRMQEIIRAQQAILNYYGLKAAKRNC